MVSTGLTPSAWMPASPIILPASTRRFLLFDSAFPERVINEQLDSEGESAVDTALKLLAGMTRGLTELSCHP